MNTISDRNKKYFVFLSHTRYTSFILHACVFHNSVMLHVCIYTVSTVKCYTFINSKNILQCCAVSCTLDRKPVS